MEKHPKSRKARASVGAPAAPAGPNVALRGGGVVPTDKSLAFLSRLATEFTAVLSLPDLLEHIMRVLREETGFDSCTLALIDERSPEVLIVKAASGLRESFRGLAIPKDQGLHGVVMRTGEPLFVPDMHADTRVYRRDNRIRSGIYVPLSVRRRQIGVLSAHRERAGAFTMADLDVLTVVGRYLTGAVEVARLHDQLKDLAATDSLTGLANRRCFFERFAIELARSRRKDRPVTVVLLDLNGFKAVNDAHGHAKGDEVLIWVGEAITKAIRTYDLAARFGGDEFILMLPETTKEQAAQVLNRLHNLRVPVPDPRSVVADLSFSWGIAVFPVDGDDPERLLQVADHRLYSMKERFYDGETLA